MPAEQPETIKFDYLPLAALLQTIMPFLDRAEPSTRLPYKSHPLYRLRRLTLYLLLLSAFLAFVVSLHDYRYPGYGGTFMLFVGSGLFILYDLISWAIEKVRLDVQNGTFGCIQHEPIPQSCNIPAADRQTGDDEHPKEPVWPRKRLLAGDVFFAICFLFPAAALFADAVTRPGYYYNSAESVFKGYIALCLFILSILHAVAWWKELMALKKGRLLRSLLVKPRHCQHCGHSDTGSSPSGGLFGSRAPVAEPKLSKTSYPIPGQAHLSTNSRDIGLGCDLEAGEGVSEASLLVTTPDEGPSGTTVRGYGSMGNSVQDLNSEVEELIVKKGKRRALERAA